MLASYAIIERSTSSLAGWWGVSITDIRLALERLHSVLSILERDDHGITFYHKSFSDFLEDPTRSGPTGFHLTEEMAAARLSRRCFEILRLDEVGSRNSTVASHTWVFFCSLALRIPDNINPLPLDDLKSFDCEQWIQVWYAKVDHSVGIFQYTEFIEKLSQLVSLLLLTPDRSPFSEQAQDPPPFQFYPTHHIQHLFSITCINFKRSMVYLRLLLVTEHADALDWDGFQSLYRGFLGKPWWAAPRICQDEPSAAQRRLDITFLCNKDRAHEFFLDIRKARKDYTLACPKFLTRGYPRTR